MNYALNSTEVFGRSVGSGKRTAEKASALAAWKRTPAVWDSVQRNEKRCINWNFALGVGSAVLVSAAGWTAAVLALSHFLK